MNAPRLSVLVSIWVYATVATAAALIVDLAAIGWLRGRTRRLVQRANRQMLLDAIWIAGQATDG